MTRSPHIMWVHRLLPLVTSIICCIAEHDIYMGDMFCLPNKPSASLPSTPSRECHMSRASATRDSVLNCSLWCQKASQRMASFVSFFSQMYVCRMFLHVWLWVLCGTHIQAHRHTCGHACGHACGGQRLMSGVSLSDYLAEPRVHWFSLASQLAPGKRCVCLLGAVLTGWPPGPSAFNMCSEVPDSVVTLEGYILYPLCHLPSLETAYF